jgi:glycosyltransferase involved in cell wall biosynthesis
MITDPPEAPLRVVSVVPSVARNTGGPAVTVVQGTRAMNGLVDRVIYATDAARPAAARPFRRISAADLPEGAAEVTLRVFRTRPPYALGFSPGLWWALRRAIPTADLVTIHSLNLFPQYAAFTLAAHAGVPYIVTPHGSLDPWLCDNSRLAKRVTNALWQRRMLSHAAAIHFTTGAEAELADPLTHGVPRIVVPNGIDVSRFTSAPRAGSFRTDYLNGYRGQIVLFLGRIARKKGIDLLIRGYARVAHRSDSLLVIAGPDDEVLTPPLMALAAELEITHRVRFVGPLYGTAHLAALRAADVWALTSHTENFGNAVVEAMAAGCPVVVSSQVNLAADITDAAAGVVTSLSTDDIARAVDSLLQSSEARARLGARATTFAAQFDWAIVAPALAQRYRRVVEEAGACSARPGHQHFRSSPARAR